MKFALINPPWTFDGSIYFGCREPHLPLEFGYARALLERAGHSVLLLDGHLHGLNNAEIAQRTAAFAPDRIVITTAPSYLFWRCAPPELRAPQETMHALRDVPAVRIVVGPHASTSPSAAIRKLGADVAVLGECEETLVELARDRSEWSGIDSIAYVEDGQWRVQGGPHACNVATLPPLSWSHADVHRHRHHHHRFDVEPQSPGAEMEVSRGCPYHCSFCAKEHFRNDYRKRPLPVLLDELDGLTALGAGYVYFIDEIFLPNKPLLEALVDRPIQFGVQTRIDLWQEPLLELLGGAGCVSIEAGVESITPQGRDLLDKGSRMSTDDITERLITARRYVPFVQANLLECGTDDVHAVEAWRHTLGRFGVWANKPVPMFPYPGSPGYARQWGPPDDVAWERAMDMYLSRYHEFSDIQDARPLPLSALEHDSVDSVR